MIEFEHPAWLWALAALAVPVLLHLLARRAAPPRDFPPAVLLEKDSSSAARSRRLKEILHLLLRLAALAAAALCFARPRLPGWASDGGAGARREPTALVLVIDDSMSTSRPAGPVEAKGPTRLGRALDEARQALRRLAPGSEAAAIFASGRSLGPEEPGKLAARLGAAEPRARARMDRALAAAGQFLEAMQPLEPAVLVLADGEAGAVPGEAIGRLRRRARVAVLDLGAAGPGGDWALLGARLDRRRLVAGEQARLLVRAARAPGTSAPASRRLELVLDGVAVAWREATLAPGAEAELPLPFTAERGVRLGELRLAGSDPWKLNDRLPVAMAAHPAVRVAVLAPRRELERAGRAVRLALSAGPGQERKAFLAELLSPRAAELADLGRYRAFVLLGPPELAAAAAARLARRVAGGAGVVILAEDPAALGKLAVPLGLPAPPAAAEPVRFQGGARLVPAGAGAALFAPFRAAALATPCFGRALRIDARGGRILARLRSGDRELAGMVERRLGRGPVLLLASGPGRRFSRLAAREAADLFVPLMHELAARAAGLFPAEVIAAPGAALAMEIPARERAARFWLLDGSGLRVPLGSPDRAGRLHMAAPGRPGGFRVVSEADGEALASRALAVRLDPGELAGRREGRREPGAAGPCTDLAGALAALAGPGRAGREVAGLLAALALALVFAEMAAAFLSAPRAPAPDSAAPARQKRGRAGS